MTDVLACWEDGPKGVHCELINMKNEAFQASHCLAVALDCNTLTGVHTVVSSSCISTMFTPVIIIPAHVL